MSTKFTIYGHPASQPSRAVSWILSLNKVPFTYKEINPTKGETLTPEFLKINPAHTLPTLVVETEGKQPFYLFESFAILSYFAEKFQWKSKELFPETLDERARLHQYVNWHHSNSRKATTEIFRPLLVGVLGGKPADQVKADIAKGVEMVAPPLDIIERWLGESPFLVGDKVTVADLMCYCELGQLRELEAFDFKGYPKISAYLDKIVQVPLYKEHAAGVIRLGAALKKRMSWQDGTTGRRGP